MTDTQLKKKTWEERFNKEFHITRHKVSEGDLRYSYDTLEADPQDIKRFIHSAVEEAREEERERIKKWAESKAGKKCAATDFIYQFLLPKNEYKTKS